MPIDLTKEKAPLGAVVFQWTVQEYQPYERDRRWYVVMGLIATALVVFAVATTNYLFALIVILFGIILYLHHVQTPLKIPFAITDTGIVIGRVYYRYSELANFWMIYQPPEVKTLYFTLNKVIRHRLQIPLLDFDPGPIRDHLTQFLTEDLEQEEEPFSDRMARLLRLH